MIIEKSRIWKKLREKQKLRQELEKTKQELEKALILARIDPLTELENRRAFDEALMRRLFHARRLANDSDSEDSGHEEEKKEKKKLVLLYFDLDKFKSINDSYGHSVGDELLKKFANFLRTKVARRIEDHIARRGGDEFAVLLEGVREEDLSKLQKHLETEIPRLLFEYGEGDHRISLPIRASVGIRVIAPEDVELINEEVIKNLHRQADAALYSSKKRGRNQVTIWKEGMKMREQREELALPT